MSGNGKGSEQVSNPTTEESQYKGVDSGNEYINVINRRIRGANKKLNQMEEKGKTKGGEIDPDHAAKIDIARKIIKENEEIKAQLTKIHAEESQKKTTEQAVTDVVTFLHVARQLIAVPQARSIVLKYSKTLGAEAKIRDDRDINRLIGFYKNHLLGENATYIVHDNLNQSAQQVFHFVSQEKSDAAPGVSYHTLAAQVKEVAAAFSQPKLIQSLTQSTQSTQTTQPVQATQTTQTTEPTQPTQPTQTQPIQATQTTQPIPAQFTQSIQPPQAAQSTQFAQPTQPVQPVQTTPVAEIPPTHQKHESPSPVPRTEQVPSPSVQSHQQPIQSQLQVEQSREVPSEQSYQQQKPRNDGFQGARGRRVNRGGSPQIGRQNTPPVENAEQGEGYSPSNARRGELRSSQEEGGGGGAEGRNFEGGRREGGRGGGRGNYQGEGGRGGGGNYQGEGGRGGGGYYRGGRGGGGRGGGGYHGSPSGEGGYQGEGRQYQGDGGRGRGRGGPRSPYRGGGGARGSPRVSHSPVAAQSQASE